MLEKLNEFWTRVGIKPAVGNAFVTAVVLSIATWIGYGGPFDLEGIRAAAYLFILGAVGVASPPSARTRMEKGGVVPKDPVRRRGV